MNKVVAIIQARMSSQRLPGKVLMDICGKPMLQRVIDRVKQAKLVDNIVVATTTKPLNRNIIRLAEECNVRSYVGSEDDVLDRYYQAVVNLSSLKIHWETIVRITADCPLIDPKVIDKVIRYYLDNGYDYVSNVGNYPDGFDVEVFSYKALKKAWEEATNPYDREHVCTYILKDWSLEVGRLEYSGLPYPRSIRFQVNTIEDLNFVRRIYGKLGDKFYLEDVLKLLENENEPK